MNEIADNFIWVRNVFVGSLALYASYTLAKKFIVKPFYRTYKFLSNQGKNLEQSLHDKFDKGIVVIIGSTKGLGPVYAKYMRTLNYPTIVLMDKDEAALSAQKQDLQKKRMDGIKVKVHTIKFDVSSKPKHKDEESKLHQ